MAFITDLIPHAPANIFLHLTAELNDKSLIGAARDEPTTYMGAA